ncbi:TonB-dependent receptor [Porticoccaceae bacterium LTM1]|nr:TonB-dependent receptor [Porticoccaceae bacterium LTM1]
MVQSKTLQQKVLTVSVASALYCASTGLCLGAKEQVHYLQINQQKINHSFLQISKAFDVQVVLSEGISEQINLPEIKGNYSLRDALERLLVDSGLTYQIVSSKTVLITQIGSVAGPNEDEAAKPGGIEEVIVTGSRIRNAKPTSHLHVIDRYDIARLGAASTAEIVASLPYNLNSVNRLSTTTHGGDDSTPFGTLGESAANLRGMGPEGTLVLVDGRRLSSSPGFEADGRINLGTIPVEAIDRIEVMLDGASAIYGSDAIAGVINIVLRKDYVGATTKVRYEESSHNADNFSLSQIFGYSWSSGNVLATLAYAESEAVRARDADWETDDLRSRGGLDSRYLSGTISGYVESSTGTFNPLFSYLNPEVINNDRWSLSDLREVPTTSDEREAQRLLVDDPKLGLLATPVSQSISATFGFTQALTDATEFYGNFIFDKVEDKASRGPISVFGVDVPATNPFNKFDTSVRVNYTFSDEYLNQNMRGVDQTNQLIRLNADAGFRISSGWRNWMLDASIGYGESRSDYNFYDISPSTFNEDFASAVAGIKLQYIAGSASQYQAVLDSSGNPIPVPAINFFEQGNNDEGLNLNALVRSPAARQPKTINKYYDISADGELFELPGGTVRMAININYRTEILDWSDSAIRVATVGAVDDKPGRDVLGFGIEFSIPLVGAENSLLWTEELLLSAAARYEDYTFEGRFSGVDQQEEKKSFNATSPRVGIHWKVNPKWTVRASWGKSFRAPSLRWLYDDQQPITRTVSDYFHPDPENAPGFIFVPSINEGYVLTENVPGLFGGNPDLKAEEATNKTVGIIYQSEEIEGLEISATWSSIEWKNRVTFLAFNNPVVAQNPQQFPELVQRDPETQVIIFAANLPLNIATRINETLDLDFKYRKETPIGEIDFGVYAIETLTQEDQLVPGAEPKELVGFQNGSDRYRIQAYTGWRGENSGVTLWANWRGGYKLVDIGGFPTGLPRMPHSTTYDLTGYVEVPKYDLTCNFGVKNLLNEKFDFVSNVIAGPFRAPWDPARFDPRGRILFLELSKEFSIQ